MVCANNTFATIEILVEFFNSEDCRSAGVSVQEVNPIGVSQCYLPFNMKAHLPHSMKRHHTRGSTLSQKNSVLTHLQTSDFWKALVWESPQHQ